MASYRLYCLDDSNHITARLDFDAVDDAATIMLAVARFPGIQCEIWELGRQVAFVPGRIAA